jgi:hypothetical protein
VRAIEQVDLPLTIESIGVVADRAVFLITGFELVHDRLPELVELLFFFDLV